jgi:hypothetical protein
MVQDDRVGNIYFCDLICSIDEEVLFVIIGIEAPVLAISFQSQITKRTKCQEVHHLSEVMSTNPWGGKCQREIEADKCKGKGRGSLAT